MFPPLSPEEPPAERYGAEACQRDGPCDADRGAVGGRREARDRGLVGFVTAWCHQLPKVLCIRYTFGMAKIDDIYGAADDFGLVTSAEARALGCSNAELVQYARRGRLERVGWGVYKIPVWPYQEASPYAAAVKNVGKGAYLYGESVVALLKLAPTNPGRIWVATPRRVRKDLGEGFHVVSAADGTKTALYEGIPCQRVADAIAAAVGAIGCERAARAADEALRLGYVTERERSDLDERLGR